MTRPAPTHVNQFRAMGTFPASSRYADESSGAYDCMVASAVMDLDAATGGRIRLTTTQARARQDDNDHSGIGLDDVAVIHSRTASAPPFIHGRKVWPTIRDRLTAGDGAIVTGRYLALGRERAPGSRFTGAHAIYVQSISGSSATVNDPLRPDVAVISVGALQRFYLSGGIGVGWSGGASSGVSTPVGASLGAFDNLVSFPVGYVITAADVDGIIGTLTRAGWFDGPAGAIAAITYRQTLMREAVGQPWGKPLQDKLAGAAFTAAGSSGDPFGIASAVGGLVAGVSEVARNGILLVAILALVLMGLWLVATAGDGRLSVPGPIGAIA